MKIGNTNSRARKSGENIAVMMDDFPPPFQIEAAIVAQRQQHPRGRAWIEGLVHGGTSSYTDAYEIDEAAAVALEGTPTEHTVNASLVDLTSRAMATLERSLIEMMGHNERLHDDLLAASVDGESYRAVVDTAAAIGDVEGGDTVADSLGGLIDRVAGAMGLGGFDADAAVAAFEAMGPEEQIVVSAKIAEAMQRTIGDDDQAEA